MAASIYFTKRFQKQYHRLTPNVRRQFDLRLELFLSQPSHPLLRTHPLKGTHTGYWSMNVSGDVRAIYRLEESDAITFVLIGTHSKLYG